MFSVMIFFFVIWKTSDAHTPQHGPLFCTEHSNHVATSKIDDRQIESHSKCCHVTLWPVELAAIAAKTNVTQMNRFWFLAWTKFLKSDKKSKRMPISDNRSEMNETRSARCFQMSEAADQIIIYSIFTKHASKGAENLSTIYIDVPANNSKYECP